MKLVDDVFEIAKSFMNDSKYVIMNDRAIDQLANTMLENGKSEFPLPEVSNVLTGIVLELVASSVNYCYWYGKSTIRPLGASSTIMYKLMLQAFFGFSPTTKNLSQCIDKFKQLLAINRFPLLEERCRHLDQLKEKGIDFCIGIENCYDLGYHPSGNLEFFFNSLIETFPGFASDIFLKRASLFFIELNRRFGWLKDELKDLHVPADYQIPKMLEHFWCIEYNDELKQDIENSRLIPKNSLQECEIRSATILTIKKLCELTNWNVADVDGFLFTKRHDTHEPFHLTITTDY